jgi:predicted nuclease of restriction endonuclease-like RecB superfamily
MLTRAHRVFHWDKSSNSISSDRLGDDCVPLLRSAIAAYRGHIGRSLSEVRNAARTALADLRPDRIEPLIDLLDSVAKYEWPRAGYQAERRLRVFDAAAHRHPLVDADEVRACVAGEFQRAPASDDEAVAMLYADYPAFHRLVVFPDDYTAEDLRSDYDLGQAQAVLYDAARLEVDAGADLRHIIQYARLSRLLHRLQSGSHGRCRIMFDGPNSILRPTHAYGVDFAKFLAALVQARDWHMRASIVLRKGWRPAAFTLTSADGLHSRVPAPRLFDSALEERFARKFGEARDGWRLRREALLLEAGERLVVPDFAFTHEDGTVVALEIVGYWTPEYLAEKLSKLERVRSPVPVIVAVRRSWALQSGPLPANVLRFGRGILLKDLMPRLAAYRPAHRRGKGIRRAAAALGRRQHFKAESSGRCTDA